jgi:hypothetical protein
MKMLGEAVKVACVSCEWWGGGGGGGTCVHHFCVALRVSCVPWVSGQRPVRRGSEEVAAVRAKLEACQGGLAIPHNFVATKPFHSVSGAGRVAPRQQGARA